MDPFKFWIPLHCTGLVSMGPHCIHEDLMPTVAENVLRSLIELLTLDIQVIVLHVIFFMRKLKLLIASLQVCENSVRNRTGTCLAHRAHSSSVGSCAHSSGGDGGWCTLTTMPHSMSKSECPSSVWRGKVFGELSAQ